ncbi:hypothetical protein PFISCL1PPCAC_12463, partial [Pristionchus fissidentatus]
NHILMLHRSMRRRHVLLRSHITRLLHSLSIPTCELSHSDVRFVLRSVLAPFGNTVDATHQYPRACTTPSRAFLLPISCRLHFPASPPS